MTSDRDAQRLKKPIFATRVDVISDEAKDDLKGWREPNYAYVLFESRVFDVKREAWVGGLFTLNVDGRPEVGQKLQQYKRKGYRIIHWGRFPTSNHPNPAVQAKVLLYRGGPDKRNPWDELESDLLNEINGGDVQLMQKKMADLEARAQAAEAKAKPAKADKAAA